MKDTKSIIYEKKSIVLIYETIIESNSYGIKITELQNDKIIDNAVVKDIASSEDRINYIFDLIVRNTVTPCTIYEILSDIL